MVGVEALCRWTHPVRGEIPPAEFIPIAENCGPDHRARRMGAAPRLPRRQGVAGHVPSSVNVSPLQFRRADFVDVVERILAETGFDPTRLELEVTESTLLGNVDTAELAMFRLKALGVRLALDDFGTGYSSLLYLRRFPFDKLKIDRSFVRIDRARGRRRRDRPRRGQPRPRPRHEGHGRRRRDRRAAPVPARGRRPFDAGLPLRPARPGGRHQHAAGRARLVPDHRRRVRSSRWRADGRRQVRSRHPSVELQADRLDHRRPAARFPRPTKRRGLLGRSHPTSGSKPDASNIAAGPSDRPAPLRVACESCSMIGFRRARSGANRPMKFCEISAGQSRLSTAVGMSGATRLDAPGLVTARMRSLPALCSSTHLAAHARHHHRNLPADRGR